MMRTATDCPRSVQFQLVHMLTGPAAVSETVPAEPSSRTGLLRLCGLPCVRGRHSPQLSWRASLHKQSSVCFPSKLVKTRSAVPRSTQYPPLSPNCCSSSSVSPHCRSPHPAAAAAATPPNSLLRQLVVAVHGAARHLLHEWDRTARKLADFRL